MNVPKELFYTKEHVWVKKLGDGSVLIGLTDKAQKDLNSMVFVNLPAVGDSFSADDVLCDVESVKSVSDGYAGGDQQGSLRRLDCGIDRCLRHGRSSERGRLCRFMRRIKSRCH